MERREYAVERDPPQAARAPLDTACEIRLDQALEDTFPASDPIASNRFD